MTIRRPFAVVPLPLTNISTNNERANRSALHLGLPQYPGMRWETNGFGSGVFARGQFGGPLRAVNYASLMATNAQPGTTFRIKLGTSQADVDSVTPTYDSGAVLIRNPAQVRADGLYHAHVEIPVLQNASWWRIDIGGAHVGDFSASALILGERREPAQFYNRDREVGFEDIGTIEIARNGVVAESGGAILRTLLFRLQWVSDTEWWNVWAPLMSTKGRRQVLFWCFDPQLSARRQDLTFLGYMTRDLFKRGNDFPKDNQVDFQLRAFDFTVRPNPVLPMPGSIPEPSLTMDFGVDSAIFVRRASDVVAQPRAFSSFVTFTRASSATRVNASGVIESVGNNVPRLDHDPVTLQPRGLLIEGQRTNLLLRSEEFTNASWNRQNVSVPSNSQIVVSSSGMFRYLHQTPNLVNGTTYTLSFDVRHNGGAQWVWLLGETIQDTFAWFDIVNGVLGAAGNSAGGAIPGQTFSSRISPMGGGWFRCELTFLVNSATAIQQVGIGISTGNATVSANQGQQVEIRNAQLEAGAFASSYIPTGASQVTRAADLATVAGANFSDWYRQDEGTLFAQASTLVPGIASAIVSAGDGTVNNRVQLTGNAGFAVFVAVGGVTQASINVGDVGVAGSRLAGAFRGDDFAASRNGGAVVTDNSGTLPVVDRAGIGQLAGVGGSQLFGHIRQIRYWPSRLTNAQLQGVTA